MWLVFGLLMVTVNGMDGLGLFLLYIDITPFNPHSLTAIPFNLHNPLYMLLVYELMIATVNSMDGLGFSFYI